jgi:hypothetical protein
MDLITNYTDLKFAIRCTDVWKNLRPSQKEFQNVLKYQLEKKGLEGKVKTKTDKEKGKTDKETAETYNLSCISLQDLRNNENK